MTMPIIRTKDKELYTKLRSLRYTDEVIIRPKNKQYMNRILNNINKTKKTIETESFGDRILLKRIKPINYKIIHSKRR